MSNLNLATTVLVIESRNSLAETALALPSNERYVVSSFVKEDALQYQPDDREGTPYIQPSMLSSALEIHHKPHDPLDGWVFGSDAERCDFQLAVDHESSGVSRRHFRIHHNLKSRQLMLTNLSKHKTTMSSPRLGEDLVRDSRVIFPGEDITVTTGRVSLSMHIPARGEHQGSFKKALTEYLNELQAAVPQLATLSFGSGSSRATPLVVQGKRNRVHYLIAKEGDIGQGAFGTVSTAIDPTTGDVYAAKRFHNGKADKEINLHQEVSHVSVMVISNILI